MLQAAKRHAKDIRAGLLAESRSRRSNLQVKQETTGRGYPDELADLLVTIDRAFEALDMPALERALEQSLHIRERGGLGRPASMIAANRVSEHLELVCGKDRLQPEGASDLKAQLLQWTQRAPQSPYAQATLADYYATLGHAYRGTGWARDVSREDADMFMRLGQAAQQVFNQSWAHCHTNWYWVLAWSGSDISAGADISEVWRRFHKRVTTNTFCPSAYWTMSIRLLPRWFGDYRQLDDFIVRSSETAKHICGDGLYAMLYTNLLEFEEIEDLHLDGERLEASVFDWLRYTPTDQSRCYLAGSLFETQRLDACQTVIESIEILYTHYWTAEHELNLVNSICREWTGR